MQKLLPFFTALALLSIAACVRNSGKSAATNESQAPQSASVGPDNQELLNLLQGKWQSETDAGYQLLISNDTMQHLNNGQTSGVSTLEIDVNCQNTACKTDSIDTSDGWCILEKGAADIQCNLVLKADTARLEYRALGAAGGGLHFRKIR